MFWIGIALIAVIAVGTAILRGWRPRPGPSPLDRLRRQDRRAADLIDDTTTRHRSNQGGPNGTNGFMGGF